VRGGDTLTAAHPRCNTRVTRVPLLPIYGKLVNHTATKQDKTADARIRAEKTRLRRIYRDMDPNRKVMAAGLIERAAFMRVQLEELEADLTAHGWVELFSQGAQEPYERARPSGQSYNTLNANYQKIIRQLDALMPKAAAAKAPEDDGFDGFVAGRDAD